MDEVSLTVAVVILVLAVVPIVAFVDTALTPSADFAGRTPSRRGWLILIPLCSLAGPLGVIVGALYLTKGRPSRSPRPDLTRTLWIAVGAWAALGVALLLGSFAL